MSRNKYLLLALLLALLPVFLTVLFYFSGNLENFENDTIEVRYNYMNPGHPVSKDIVMVDLDEQFFKAYNLRWPIRRDLYPPVLNLIAAGEPKLIVFDITFFGSSPDEDAELALASREIEIVSHALQFRTKDIKVTPRLPKAIRRHALPVEAAPDAEFLEYNVMDFPDTAEEQDEEGNALPGIGAYAPLAHSVTMQSEGGVSRRARMLFKYRDKYYPSLSLRVFHKIGAIKTIEQTKENLILTGAKGKTIVPLKDGRVDIHYQSRKDLLEGIPRLSFAALLDTVQKVEAGVDLEKWSINPEKDFKDKVVIIGSSASGAYDEKTTPYGKLPGMYLHASLISSLETGIFLKRIPLWVGLLVLIISVPLICLLVFSTGSMPLRIIVPTAVFLIYIGASYLLFQNHYALPLAPMILSFPASFLILMIILSVAEGQEKRKFKSAMSKYLSPDVLNEVMSRGDLQAEVGQRKNITVMFTDIRSFTTLSEGKDPATVVEILNEYLHRMVAVIFKEQGTLDKYIGDAIMAFWGAPIEREDHALRAVRSGLEMLQELDDLHVDWKKREMPLLKMGVGVHTGEMIVGNIGSIQRLDYTVIGDNVNLGSRLEGLTKNYGVSILISEPTYEIVKDTIPCRPMDLVAVKGKTIPIAIFEPLDDSPMMASMTNMEYAARFARAFQAYRNREWDQAIELYSELKNTTRGPDHTAGMMIERCQDFKVNDPGASWDGVLVMKTK